MANFARILAGAVSGYGKVLSDEAEEARKRALLELERQFADAELLEQRGLDDENVSGIAEEDAGNSVGAGPRGGLVPGAQFEPGPNDPPTVWDVEAQREAFAGGDEDAARAVQGAQDVLLLAQQQAGAGGAGATGVPPDFGPLPVQGQSGAAVDQARSGGGQALADGSLALPPELRELGQGMRVRDDDSGSIYIRRGDRLMPVVADSAPLSDAGAGTLVAGQQFASAVPAPAGPGPAATILAQQQPAAAAQPGNPNASNAPNPGAAANGGAAPLLRPLGGPIPVKDVSRDIADGRFSPDGAERWRTFSDGTGRPHGGTDYDGNIGDPVVAPLGGTAYRAVIGQYGNVVVIQHPNGEFTLHAHLDSVDISNHQQVQPGEQIGTVGISGRPSGSVPHLHFEVWNGGITIDRNGTISMPGGSAARIPYRVDPETWLPSP